MWKSCIQSLLEICMYLEVRLLQSVSSQPQSCLQQQVRRDAGVLRFCFSSLQGYYRAGYSLLQLLKPYEAAHMFFKGLRLVQVNQDQTQFADFLVGVFTTMGSKSGLGEARPLSFF